MRFEVYESCTVVRRLEIEADTREEAYHKWLMGQGEITDADCGDAEDFELLEINLIGE